ncbi:MAG: SDR family NAD(P)-dependent oxidoreductase [Anaerolineales bacterium]
MIYDQNIKVAAITGATGAIGKAIASELSKMKYRVVLITRDHQKSVQTVKDIISESGNPDVSYRIADLSRKNSIQSLTDSWNGPLHVLINNAAITPRSRQVTPEGIELQFATNVLGYFWMTSSFSDILAETSPSRVINVASYWAGGLDLSDLEFNRRPYHNHDAYRQSKQADRMLTPIFGNQFYESGISVNACHPGDVNSTLSNNLGFGGSQTPRDGAKTPVWLATAESLDGISGRYFENQREAHCQFSSLLEDSEKLYEICSSY